MATREEEEGIFSHRCKRRQIVKRMRLSKGTNQLKSNPLLSIRNLFPFKVQRNLKSWPIILKATKGNRDASASFTRKLLYNSHTKIKHSQIYIHH